MCDNKDFNGYVTSVPTGVDDAVGVSESEWYVAVMQRPRSEKAAAERLIRQGYDVYVATQKVWRIWRNGKRKRIDKVVIPSVIFIHCTERERLTAVQDSYISHFMTDRAGNRKVAVIPNRQIERLKFMLGQSDIPVTISDRPYRVGDRVRVLRGSLMGLEGEIINLKSAKSELVVSLDFFGCAKLSIDTVNLEIIP